MANPDRGEVDLKIGEDSYTLRLSSNALAEIEDLLGLPFGELVAQMGAGRIGAQRAMVFAALRDKHPKLSLIDAGNMLDRDRDAVAAALGKALSLAFPDAEAAKNPPTASGETGATS